VGDWYYVGGIALKSVGVLYFRNHVRYEKGGMGFFGKKLG
jgi:hypothetical protein